MSSVGKISLDLNVNSKNFNKQVNGIQKETTKAFGLMSVAIGNIFADMAQRAVTSVGNFVKDTINKGSELAELQNVVDSVFTTMADKVEEFSQSALENFGLTEAQAKKMVGTYGAMSKSFGYTEAQAYDMSTALAGLTADVASFYNLNHDEAYTKMKSVFTGETESLKELGVVMTQTALDEFALAQGFAKTTKDMSEQEKVALRLAFVQNQLSTASGDFIRTQDQWANQTRILTGQFDSLKASLGQGLINVLTPAIRAINTLMAKLIQLANLFKDFTAQLMGSSGGGGAGAAMAEVAEAADSAAASTGGIASAAGGAAKAAKEAKKALMGFDEINKLSGNNDSDSGSVGGGGGVSLGAIATPDISGMLSGTEKEASGFAKSISNALSKIDFGPIKKSFERLKAAVEPIIDKIGSALKWLLDNALAPLAKWTIEDALPAFMNLLSGALTVLNPLIESFKPLFEWLWVNFLQPIAVWTGGIIVDTLNLLADALTRIGEWMTANQPIVDAITLSIVSFFAAWKLVTLMSFIQQSGGVIAAFSAITAAVKAATVAKLADKAETVALTLMYAKDFVVSVASGTAALATQAAQWVATTAVKVAATAATVASTVATGAATVATWAFNAALAVLTSPITLVIAAVAALVAGVILLIKNFDAVKGVAKVVFTSIADVAKKAINGILAGIEAFINGIISGFNFMIRAMNKLSFDVPDWVPEIGGKKFGFNIKELSSVSLPRLAEGGYLKANQPTLAMVGDNKTQGEIVAPEGKMLEVMLQALESFFSRFMGQVGDNQERDYGDIVIPIYLDGTMLDEVIVTAQQRRALRSGGV